MVKIPEFKIPEAVVVDTSDGYTLWRDADAVLFTVETARKFAERRNVPGDDHWVVRQLTEVPGEDTNYVPFSQKQDGWETR